MTGDIRARARDAVRAELADAVVRVLLERGFDVTSDELAATVGVSRATFFRYFSNKEDAVVAAMESASHPDFSVALASAPTAGFSAWQLVRVAVEPMLKSSVSESERRDRLRLIRSRPTLRARFTESRHARVGDLAEALSPYLGGDAQSARVIASAALAALDVAWHEWSADNDAVLTEVVDATFEVLEQAGRA